MLTTSLTFSPRVLGEKVLLLRSFLVPLVLRLVLLPISASITSAGGSISDLFTDI